MNTYHIAYILDPDYFMPTMVSMASFTDTCKSNGNNYVVHVIYNNLSEDQKRMLGETAADNICLDLLDVDEIEIPHKMDSGQVYRGDLPASAAALLKFSLADILKDLDRVLYIDGDTVIKKDLTPLMDMDMKGYALGAVLSVSALFNNNIKISGINNYFNSGVLLMDMNRFRKEDLGFRLYQEKAADTTHHFMDEGIFNRVFRDNYQTMPLKYNMAYPAIVREYYLGKLTMEKINRLYKTAYQSLNEIYEDSCVVHFASNIKPWKYTDAPGTKLWDHYYKLSPVYSGTIQRKRLHLNVLHSMGKNKVTKAAARTIFSAETEGVKKTLKKISKKLKEQ